MPSQRLVIDPRLHTCFGRFRAILTSISEELYDRAFQLYQERRDKEWGITGCVSFVVMKDRRLTSALTTDVHYQQAGFRALLREG